MALPACPGQNGSGVDFAAQGVNNSLMLYWSADGITTSSSDIVDGDVAFSAPAMVLNGDGVDMTAVGPDGSLYDYWAQNGSATWGAGLVAPPGSVG